MSDQSLVEVLDKVETRFNNAPVGITFEKEKSYAVQLFRNNEYLAKVAQNNLPSLLSAMSNVASIGLSLNPAKKQAYLVPRNGQICLDPSYMGMCDLATQSGMIEFVQAKIVRENDTYENQGVDAQPLHKYDPFKDRGDIVGVYCVAKTSKGDYLTTEMSRAKIDDIRDRSEYYKRKQKGPWATDYEEMAKKTVIRNAFKTWPKTETLERLEMAVELSNQNEGFAPIVTSPELNQYNEEQKKHYDYLITQSDAIGMHCFMSSLDEGVQTSLHNSFEKGTITKYKKIVSELQRRGCEQLIDMLVVIKEACASGDDLAAKEILEGLQQEAIDYLINGCNQDEARFIRECLTEEAA